MPRKEWISCALLLLAFWALSIGTQLWDGAFQSELSFEPDEPAHFVTGLMLQNYIADGLSIHPMRFAERYYLHYPKVAIGHWPPIFYVVEALWFFAFGGTIQAALGLQALITGVLALMIFAALRPLLAWWALTPAAWFILLRSTRFLSGAVMLELLAVVFELCAVYSWIRYMKNHGSRWAYLFALAASAALMTRGDAMFLMLFPAAAIALGGRWRILLRPLTWGCASIVGILCGPWYLLTLQMVQDGWQAARPNISYVAEASRGYIFGLPALVGGGVVLLAVIGMCFARKIAGHEEWASWLALALSLLLFQIIIPASVEERRMAPLTPVLLIFAGYGAVAVKRHFSSYGSPGLWLSIGIVVHAGVAITPPKRHFGYREIVADVLAMPEGKGRNFLASSAVDGEGLTISEIAAAENVPVRYVLRASKLLASSNWNGGTYRSLYKTPQEMMNILESSPAQIILCDTFPDHTPSLTFEVHTGMLHTTIATFPKRFRLLARRQGPQGEIFAYLLDEGLKSKETRLEIDLKPKLGRTIRD